MPKFCHGKGNPDTDGCCWVDGRICPLRLKISGGRVYEGPDLIDRGTINQFVAGYGNKQARDRAAAQLTGPVIACRAAVDVIASNGTLVTDRVALDAAWISHADYQALVRPAWERAEVGAGLAAGALDCPIWVGSAGIPQCCYAEDDVTNAAQQTGLSTAAVEVRSKKAL